ncbi:Ribonuclease E [Paenibacillus pasadenensis]|uniref:Ribonuclease E n=1 Tax=Paenibacillus pasadenensis TaxID=217090 RepID=A0A2N5NCC3_9BACL|nr:hypothetical protein [Paenibacillus pasadenensis]PLT47973.1 Ribonuclease E [Paenibacillus pasadenensis]
MNMKKTAAWLGKLAAGALLVSVLSIWTTGYIVTSYVEVLLKQFHIPLQMQPLSMSGVWGTLWGAERPEAGVPALAPTDASEPSPQPSSAPTPTLEPEPAAEASPAPGSAGGEAWNPAAGGDSTDPLDPATEAESTDPAWRPDASGAPESSGPPSSDGQSREDEQGAHPADGGGGASEGTGLSGPGEGGTEDADPSASGASPAPSAGELPEAEARPSWKEQPQNM